MVKILNFNKFPAEKEAEEKGVKADNIINKDNIVEFKRTPEIMLKNLRKRYEKLQNGYDLLEFEYQGTHDKESFLKKCEKFKMEEVNPLFNDIAEGWNIMGYVPKYVDALDRIQEEVREIHLGITDIIWEILYGKEE